MKGDTNIQHETKMEQIVLNYLDQDPDIRAILEIMRSLELKDSWLAAGCVRNFIWNMLSE